MPDTLKRLYNGTINITGLTGNQTATLFTNNSTTRSVIKDVHVSNSFPATPNLTVNGTAVSALSGDITGSEIVDVSEAVGVSFTSPLALTSQQTTYYIGTLASASNQQRIVTSYFINGTLQNSTTTVDQNTPTLDAAATYVTAVYTAPDGDVFSVQTNGDTNWLLLKNAGSASGTRTTINTGYTTTYKAIAFDGVNTFYWVTSTTNVRAFNADTETTTDITIAALNSAGSTRARLNFSNGYLFFVATDNAAGYLIEVSTGRWVYLTGTQFPWGNSQLIPGFWFDTTTRVITYMWYKTAATTGYYVDKSFAIPALTASSVTNSTAWQTTQTVTNTGFQGQAANTTYPHISLSSADGGVIIANSGQNPCVLSGISGPTTGWTLSTTPLVNRDAAEFRPRAAALTPTVNTTNFPSTITLRITGVETTA